MPLCDYAAIYYATMLLYMWQIIELFRTFRRSYYHITYIFLHVHIFSHTYFDTSDPAILRSIFSKYFSSKRFHYSEISETSLTKSPEPCKLDWLYMYTANSKCPPQWHLALHDIVCVYVNGPAHQNSGERLPWTRFLSFCSTSQDDCSTDRPYVCCRLLVLTALQTA